MRLTILSVGRLKRGAEHDLFQHYVQRVSGAGQALAIEPLKAIEVAQSRRSSAAERRQREDPVLLAKLDPGARLVALEEKGKSLNSAEFAALIGKWREEGVGEIAFALGGPDGLGDEVRQRASMRLALGPMTLPHGLARIVLAEQIYRALTILAGHPYHRD